MTDIDSTVVPVNGPDIVELGAPDTPFDDIGDLVNQLAELAASSPEPVALMAGRMAIYPMADGGMMMVTDCPYGMVGVTGVKHTRVPPAMVRALGILVGGGSKAQAVKAALFGGRARRRSAIGDGR